MKFSAIIFSGCVLCLIFFIAPIKANGQNNDQTKPKGLGNTLTGEQMREYQKLNAKPQTETQSNTNSSSTDFEAGVNSYDRTAARALEEKKEIELAVAKYKLTPVTKNDKWGYTDVNGNIVIPIIYENFQTPACGFYGVKLNNKWGFVDRNGKVLIDFQFDDLRSVFTEELSGGMYSYNATKEPPTAWVVKNGKKFKIDRFGHMIDRTMENANENDVKINYEEYRDFDTYRSNLRPVKLNGKWGFLDRYDYVVIPMKYDDLETGLGIGSDGFTAVKLNGKWEFINKKGEDIIAPTYDKIDGFYKGISAVCLNYKWGYIDTTGKVIIPLIYDYATYFNNPTAMVMLNHKSGAIDRTGKIIIEFKYDMLIENRVGYRAELKKKFGFIDMYGNEILPIKYDTGYFIDTYFEVTLKGRTLYFDETGKKIDK